MGKAQSKLSPEMVLDLLPKTQFGSLELEQWHRSFDRAAPFGYLTAGDFNRIYSQYFPFGNATEFSNIVFRRLDTKKVGMVTFEEFIVAFSIIAKGKLSEKLRWAFSLYDLDGDGTLSYEDIYKTVESIHLLVGAGGEETPEKKTRKIFGMIGKDTNEKISYDEYGQLVISDPLIIQSLFLYDGFF